MEIYKYDDLQNESTTHLLELIFILYHPKSINMKYTFTLLFLVFVYLLSAQESVNTVEFNPPQEQKLVNKYSCFFKTMENQNRLFKIGINSSSNNLFNKSYSSNFNQVININSLELGFEQKIKTGISFTYTSNLSLSSIIHEIKHPKLEVQGTQRFNELSNIFMVRNAIESRWYFNKRKKLQKGVSGNNLSGYYLGIKGEMDNWRKLGGYEGTINGVYLDQRDPIIGRNFNALITGGLQQQFGKNGYININLGAGRSWQSKDIGVLSYNEEGQLNPFEKRKNWFIDYRVSYGWAFGGKSSYAPKDCSILQFFEEEKRLFKVDLFNTLQRISNVGIGGTLYTEYEQKLGKSSFSLSLTSELNYHIDFQYSSIFLEFALGSELRYYYNLKKRIRKGKTGNNLSANYFGVSIKKELGEYGELVYSPMWGMQRKLFKNLYTDIKIGYNNIHEDILDGLDSGEFTGTLKIGFAF